ncbi:MAG: hypothetical protein IPH44_28280 [Myxococcales bacterium]|nr:hypothetical protein [Myxococcales bacterium]
MVAIYACSICAAGAGRRSRSAPTRRRRRAHRSTAVRPLVVPASAAPTTPSSVTRARRDDGARSPVDGSSPTSTPSPQRKVQPSALDLGALYDDLHLATLGRGFISRPTSSTRFVLAAGQAALRSRFDDQALAHRHHSWRSRTGRHSWSPTRS